MTFDGPGESVELRLTARDRTAYADGALAAARWLAATTAPRASTRSTPSWTTSWPRRRAAGGRDGRDRDARLTPTPTTPSTRPRPTRGDPT